MGTIQAGVGLISGLNTSSIIDQLIAIDARPRDLLTKQTQQMDTIKSAWLSLSAQLLAIQSAAANFDDAKSFQNVAAASSNPSVLTATAAAGTAQGDYQFTPARLMSSHQVISAGRPDADTSPVGAGTITIDLGHSQLNPATPLDLLNGQSGVPRGSIKITDRGGAAATIDLTAAVTMQDVLDAINHAAGIAVTASASGDSIVLTDTSGGSSNPLSVAEVNSGSTAAGLGILGSAVGNVLTGGDIVRVTAATPLSVLNDGTGVRTSGGDDIQFALENGTNLTVNLYGKTTVGAVLDAINSATNNGGKLVAALDGDGHGITLTDTTGGSAGPLTVTALGGSKAALDLGLLGSDGDSDHVINGRRLVAGLNDVLLRNLNGGSGVAAGSISIQDRGTGSAVIDLSGAQTVGDVIAAINAAAGVSVSAALNSVGDGIVITDTSGQSLRNFTIAEAGGTTAADLHIAHDAADATADSGNLNLRYISENTRLADMGVALGKFVITDSAGHSAKIDLTARTDPTLGQVMGNINTAGLGVTASIDTTGTGLLLTDTAGGAGKLTVAESGSTTASDLGILGSDSDGDRQIDGTRRITLTVGASDTLRQVATAVNSATGRVSAVVINDGTSANPYRLVLSSKVGGLAGRLVIDPGTTGLNFATMTQPQDALLFIGDPANPNSVAVRSRSNSVSNVIDGLTLNMAGASSTPVTISVAATIDAKVSQIKSFVSAFNTAVVQVNTATAYDATTNTAGVLQGDATAMQVRDSLFAMITKPVSGVSGSITRLAQVGFSVTNNGKAIAFNEDKFRQAYAADPAGVGRLFTQATTGAGDRIKATLDRLTDSSTGVIQRQVDSLDTRHEMYDQRIAEMNALLASKRTRLTAQFNAMEQALAQMQSQSSALSSLASLAANFYTSTGTNTGTSGGIFGSSSSG